ncbi:MAG: transcriptional regulator [Verrucomicrobia bacterium]|nr:transcriptional regulator [Verrucomicrobiota bacterium]
MQRSFQGRNAGKRFEQTAERKGANMKLITAYIQRFMTEKVTDALRQINVHGVTMLHCEGFGRRANGEQGQYLDKEVETGFAPKTKLEIVCPDGDTGMIVQAIRVSAHTGHHGEGKILVSTIDEVTDIHSGATGESVF